MYTPAPFAVSEDEAWRLLGEARLGVLVTGGPGGLEATHLPFVVDRGSGVLVGHLARLNPQAAAEGEALVIFPGPDAYVSPSWYASKAEHGRVVPTWDYEAVHVRGVLRRFEDRDRLLATVERLTDRFEAERDTPWAVSDAPAAYVGRLLGGIVGVELVVTAVEGKRKLSQNKPAADRLGVREGLMAGTPGDRAVAALMAALPA